MKTPEQLKGAIRNIAKKHSLMPQEVLQMFLFERILERLSVSRYKGNFILISDIMKEISTIDVGDGITFGFVKIEPIREDDFYDISAFI